MASCWTRNGRKMSKSLGNVTAPQEVTDKLGADILRLWVVNSDVSEDLRIGPEILKQQAELYRRLRNTLRWLLGSLAGFTDDERVPDAEMPELERWVLHRLAELDQRMRAALATHDWTGVYPEHPRVLLVRPVRVLLRRAQGCTVLRPRRQHAAQGGADGAGSSASLPDRLARASAVLHRGGGLAGPVPVRGRQRASAVVPAGPRRLARPGARRAPGPRSARSAARSRPCWRRHARIS